MTRKDQLPDVLGRSASAPPAGGSFHGNLLIRSRTSLTDSRKPRLLARLSVLSARLVPLITPGATFAGGLAIGAGAMLHQLGTAPTFRPALWVIAGFGCLVLAALAGLRPREGRERRPSTA